MITSQQFFEDLREGDEYMSCFMTKEVYSGIEHELKERICVNTVKVKNPIIIDEVHKELIKNVSKAKKVLIEYEYNINHV